MTSCCEWAPTKPRKTLTWFALHDGRPLFAFVLGEPMWPRLRFMGNAWVCGGFASTAFATVIALKIFNPADALMGDVSGV